MLNCVKNASQQRKFAICTQLEKAQLTRAKPGKVRTKLCTVAHMHALVNNISQSKDK